MTNSRGFFGSAGVAAGTSTSTPVNSRNLPDNYGPAFFDATHIFSLAGNYELPFGRDKRFGSGWALLVQDASGISVISTANQDSPLMNGQTPILGVDVWEHAYYVDYRNRRPDYLKAWWNTVNWEAVASRFKG